MGIEASQKFTASGSWTAPSTVVRARVEGFGGGGGGGQGRAAGGPNNGSGGGGGAILRVLTVPVVPGTTYTVTIGAGGSGGVYPSPNPTTGGDTTFGTLAIFRGASFGSADTAGAETTVTSGGMSFKANAGGNAEGSNDPPNFYVAAEAAGGSGGGGQGAGLRAGVAGNDNMSGYGAFTGGAAGAVSSAGGGGGGGAGPNGNGGAAGAGAPNVSVAGVAGTAAASNSGAGGGGGGGGGSTSGNGGNGGNGGSGQLTVYWQE